MHPFFWKKMFNTEAYFDYINFTPEGTRRKFDVRNKLHGRQHNTFSRAKCIKKKRGGIVRARNV